MSGRARFELPDELVIGRTRYAVHVDPGLRERGVEAYFDRRTRQILIGAHLTRAQREEALVHEVLHALLPDDIPAELEERVVEHLDGRLVRVLRQLRWSEP